MQVLCLPKIYDAGHRVAFDRHRRKPFRDGQFRRIYAIIGCCQQKKTELDAS